MAQAIKKRMSQASEKLLLSSSCFRFVALAALAPASSGTRLEEAGSTFPVAGLALGWPGLVSVWAGRLKKASIVFCALSFSSSMAEPSERDFDKNLECVYPSFFPTAKSFIIERIREACKTSACS